MPSPQLSPEFKLDLRSPGSAKLRRGAAISWLRVFTLLCLDVIALSVGWRLARAIGTQMNSPWTGQDGFLFHLVIVFVGVGVISARGLYAPGDKRRDYLGLVQAITLAVFIILLTAFLYDPNEFVSRSTFLLFWFFSVCFVCLGRFFVDASVMRSRAKGAIRYPVFIITDESREQHCNLVARENRYDILGVADSRCLDRDRRNETLHKLQELGIAEIFVSWEAIKNRMFVCWHFQTAGITVHILPNGAEPVLPKSEMWIIGGQPSLTYTPPAITGTDFWTKRLFDFFASAALILAFSPILITIGLLIRLDSPGPIFFRQVRVGLHGRHFKAWKFRTMVQNAEKLQRELEASNEMKDGVLFKMKHDPRVTKIGGFLRRYSLDELPQLFNVLMGEMSLVGPRPLPVRDVERFSEYHYLRHEVLPGITGLWQVSGRSDITDFEQAIGLDVAYIENWSLWLDLKILFDTVGVVLLKKGAY
ncbi:sugar transferase [Leptolyngbya sp. AN02str]|uniref:sugar transferase n=1 Tax=Leptolyngbya sp. AN02str TaxID=3423363 RepID=UPI003D31CA30